MAATGKIALFLAIALTVNVAAHAEGTVPRYYCPKSNAALVRLSSEIRVIPELSSLPFPRVRADIGHGARSVRGEDGFYVDIKDCSDEKFLCLQAKERKAGKPFYLFLPRQIQALREYQFRGMRAVTQYTTMDKPWEQFIQVVLWQDIGAVETPIKLTLEANRGVLYWDGIDFWQGKYGGPETCVLESLQGLFSEVKIIDSSKHGSEP